MKSILIAIRPQWVEKIASGKKIVDQLEAENENEK